jgi:predicted permease
MPIEDLCNAFKRLRSAPWFAITTILSLSVGIGASVSMFTVANCVLLKPLPYPESGRLVSITNAYPAANASLSTYGDNPGLFAGEFIRWRKQVRSLESIALSTSYGSSTATLTGTDRPEYLGMISVSAEYFDTLKVQPQLGRWFRESEEQPGAPNVVILSDALWLRRFSARRDIIGQIIHISDVAYEVVGIAPPSLKTFLVVPDRVEVFRPVRFSQRQLQSDTADDFTAIARLKPGVTMEQVRAELDSTLAFMPEYHAAFTAFKARVDVQALQAVVVSDARRGLLLLLLSVGLVLLIACVNVANLSLVRYTQRARELALRVALGASRRELIQYALTESLLIAVTGTIVGFLLSQWITEFAISHTSQLPRAEEVVTDTAVVWFAIGICVLTTLLFGSLPAWRVSKVDPLGALNAGSRGNTDALRGGRIRTLLIAAEVALGTVLVIGSGLLLRSFHEVMNTPRGFDGHDSLYADVVLPSPRYGSLEKQASFFFRLRDNLISKPGVSHVAVNTRAPLNGDAIFTVFEGGASKPLNELTSALWPSVTSDYFGIMKIPLRSGRLFRDAGETERVAVVSESVARRMWPGQNPIGKQVRKSNAAAADYSRVVGVVGDVLSSALDRSPTPAIYQPYTQRGGSGVPITVVIQASVPPSSLAASIREAVSGVDADVPVKELRPMQDLIAKSVQVRVFQTSLLGAFALIAVSLAAIGIYSVVAYSILQRRQEIGVRVALGASPKDVVRLVTRNGMTPVLAGLASGTVTAAVFAKLLSSLLFHVRPLDPVTFFSTPIVFILVAAVPCWLISRKASRIDPMDSLRSE